MFIMGPEVAESEQAFAEYIGCKHVITCGSGTDAAIVAMMAWGIGCEAEVITTGFSFIATVETICLVGATPIMVDIDPRTYNIDVAEIEKAITDKTVAIQPVSLYGQPSNMDEINALAKKHNLKVIEDGAQSFGAAYKDKKSLNLSDCGVTSFFQPNLWVATAMEEPFFTNDDEEGRILPTNPFHGQTGRYYHERIGVNGRMDTFAVRDPHGKAEGLPRRAQTSARVGGLLRRETTTAHRSRCDVAVCGIRPNFGLGSVHLESSKPRAASSEAQEKGIPTSVHYPRTMADQPAYSLDRFVPFGLKESEKAAQEVMSLPMHPYMTDEHREQITTALLESF